MNDAIARTLARVSGVVRRLEDAVLVALLSAMILIGGAQIVMRNFVGEALGGADEAQRLIVLWLAILGAVVASRDRRQLRIDLVSRYLRGPLRLLLEAFGDRLVGGIPAGVVQAVIPVGFALIALRHLLDGLLALAGRRRDPGAPVPGATP